MKLPSSFRSKHQKDSTCLCCCHERCVAIIVRYIDIQFLAFDQCFDDSEIVTKTSPVHTRLSKIKSSLYMCYYAEACNEWRGSSPRLSAWAAQLRRNVASVASRWRHCIRFDRPGIELWTSRTDSVRLTTELTDRSEFFHVRVSLFRLLE